jgi:hypothetical protein
MPIAKQAVSTGPAARRPRVAAIATIDAMTVATTSDATVALPPSRRCSSDRRAISRTASSTAMTIAAPQAMRLIAVALRAVSP